MKAGLHGVTCLARVLGTAGGVGEMEVRNLRIPDFPEDMTDMRVQRPCRPCRMGRHKLPAMRRSYCNGMRYYAPAYLGCYTLRPSVARWGDQQGASDMANDRIGPELVPGETWFPRPPMPAREILDRDTRRGGEALVHFREGSTSHRTTEASFRQWIAACAASLEPESDG